MPQQFKRSELGRFTTVSEKLRKARERRGLSLAACASALAVQEKFLSLLEESRYQELPGELYVRTWIKKYGGYLGLNPADLITSYEQERKVRSRLTTAPATSQKPLRRTIWDVLTLRRLWIAALIMMVIGYGVYLGYLTIRPPRVTLGVPATGFRTDENSIILKGQTESGVSVTVNRQPLILDTEHRFELSYSLAIGLNTITIEARKKFSRPFTTTLSVVRTEPPAVEPSD